MLRKVSTHLVLIAALGIMAPVHALAQDSGAKEIIQKVVNNEIAADSGDHSHWMYKEKKKTPEKSTTKLVVETRKANLSRLLEIDGRPPSAEQRASDESRRKQLISDPAEQQKQAADRHSDGKKANDLLRMLPEGFLWSKVSEANGVGVFQFKPNPNFNPPSREAQVFAAMAGTMTVDMGQLRLKSLKGRLIRDVEFGWGILGRLRKGGSFNIERAEVAPKEWEIVATHVHISGRALLFKSIDQNEDDETSDYKRVPNSLSLEEAAALLKKDGAQEAKNRGPAPSRR
ncbi:MAG: hypothetical protein ABI383_16500 [Acidobacteriaceae bacterium]